MMNGKHRAPRKYTHIEKIRIMNDAVVFMFGCMTLVCEIRVGSFLFFEMNVLLLLPCMFHVLPGVYASRS